MIYNTRNQSNDTTEGQESQKDKKTCDSRSSLHAVQYK